MRREEEGRGGKGGGGPHQPRRRRCRRPSRTPRRSRPRGLLINGSVNNAATSQYSMSQAFGNTRSGGRSLYNYGLSLVLNNSALNAKPYSLTGLDTPSLRTIKSLRGWALAGR